MTVDVLDIGKRKGKVILSKKFLSELKAPTLETLFSNFYPLAIVQTHEVDFYDHMEYYGLSPLFDEVDEGCEMPKYSVKFKRSESGDIKLEGFNKMEKLWGE